MAKRVDEIVAEVQVILGTSDRVEIAADDASVVDLVGQLNKARVRLELSKQGLAVDFSGDTLTIYRIGVAVGGASSGTGEDKGSAKPGKPKSQPTPKRHQHTFVAPKCVGDLISILSDDASHVVWFQGPTGTGKTVVAQYLAKELGMKLYQINGHDGMGHEDFFGDKTVDIDPATGQNHIVFQDGPVVKAMQEGLDADGNEVGSPALLFIDEAAAIPPHIAIGLNRLLESDDPRRTITLEKDGGRIVRSHSGFRVILAANTCGRGTTGLNDAAYTAQTDALDISLLNRVSVVFRFGYDKKVERHILQEKIGDDKIVRLIERYRDAIRGFIKSGDCSSPFSTRHLVKIADQFRIFKDLGKAIYYSTFGFILPEEVAKYNETAVAVLAKDLLVEFTDNDVDYM